jgi:hypothetical protein
MGARIDPRVSAFLSEIQLSQYSDAFGTHDILFDMLGTLTDQDLIMIGIASLGHRKHILAAASALANRPIHPGPRVEFRLTEEEARSLLGQIPLGRFTISNIPVSKLENAIATYAGPLAQDERPVALLDVTIFGSGKDGILFTDRAIYWKCGISSAKGKVDYRDLTSATAQLSWFSKIALVNGHKFSVAGTDDESARAAIGLAAAIAAESSVREMAEISLANPRLDGNAFSNAHKPMNQTATVESLPKHDQTGAAESPQKHETAIERTRRLRSAVFWGIALIALIIYIIAKPKEGSMSSSGGSVQRQNGQIPGFSECLTRPELFRACCYQVGGNYLPYGTSGVSSFPTCVR